MIARIGSLSPTPRLANCREASLPKAGNGPSAGQGAPGRVGREADCDGACDPGSHIDCASPISIAALSQ